MNELVLSPEWQSDHSTFQQANGPNDRLCPPPPLFPGKLINPIVVSCLDRTEFCDWIQHFKAADVPVLTPPPPVYDIIYTPTHREVRPALQKQLHCSQLLMNHNYRASYLHLVCELVSGMTLSMRKSERGDRQNGPAFVILYSAWLWNGLQLLLQPQSNRSLNKTTLSNILIYNIYFLSRNL